MNLSQYLTADRGRQSELSRRIGAHAPDVSRWASGERRVPPDRCPAIELATAGEVTCEELRPDVRWQRVPDADWPHPGGRPLIDVARQVVLPVAAPEKAAA